ncbi:aminotransferase class I/II-fold pyridoxal phosphate-dependent enzyme [Acidimicrobiia bacterium EGI L10123]|uniref:aminotransferase class I/II-fold pyridoxal phosphate-dependent enzyme n=1 Tax=Salinilacustrithrix flava TaxID=2957203 RepID=UPI003D7C1B38|nr:aminotransferase class I/II-fold pyridoxal phosphate-dependent enzyme [Acidimicrobiia bacterium EGI L10123]
MTGTPAPGPHGGDVDRVAAALGRPVEELLDLSASLNPLAPDVRPVLRAALDGVGRYPDDARATAALAEAIGVDPARLVLTNGGAEAIALVARLRPVGWAEECDFSLYRRHLARLDPAGPRWRSDPHNPTGRLAAPDDVADVRDEAFYLLATASWTRGDPGVTALGSLTKAWAIPGIRIGYVVARDDAEADALRGLRPRWSVNGLVCAALPALLDLADPSGWRAGIAQLRSQLHDVLVRHDLAPEPSDSPYVWVPGAAGLRDRLLAEGVVVRHGGTFGHPDAVRIAVPDADGLERLERALSATDHRSDP